MTHHQFIGQSKSNIISQLINQETDYIEFLCWLFIPTYQLLLSFEKQICQQTNIYL